jgi:hypothetical protein
VTLHANAKEAAEGLDLGFDLDERGGAIYLYDRSGSLIDSVEYGQQLPDLSMGRTGVKGEWHLTTPTVPGPNIAHPLGDPACAHGAAFVEERDRERGADRVVAPERQFDSHVPFTVPRARTR